MGELFAFRTRLHLHAFLPCLCLFKIYSDHSFMGDSGHCSDPLEPTFYHLTPVTANPMPYSIVCCFVLCAFPSPHHTPPHSPPATTTTYLFTGSFSCHTYHLPHTTAYLLPPPPWIILCLPSIPCLPACTCRCHLPCLPYIPYYPSLVPTLCILVPFYTLQTTARLLLPHCTHAPFLSKVGMGWVDGRGGWWLLGSGQWWWARWVFMYVCS